MNKIKFTVEDIVNKFEEIIPLSAQERNAELAFLAHELNGRYACVKGFADLLISESSDNIFEAPKNYFTNIRDLSIQTSEETKKIILNYRDKTEDQMIHFHKNEIVSASEKIVTNLNNMLSYTPVIEKANLKNISAEYKESAEILDQTIDAAIEMYNQHFSPEYLLHDLDKEIKDHAKKYGADSKGSVKIEKIDDITYIGPANYLRGVMLVLEKNIHDHSTNPENDIAHRLTPDFEKKMKVWIEPNHDEGFLTVYVQDNGFGINPNIQDKLFEKGASTKTDKTTEHGIGLWYVKNFVEKRGGTIGFKTELGYGTTFNFTIPYDCIYKRDQYADKSIFSIINNEKNNE